MNERDEAIRALTLRGMSSRAIADNLGCSPGTVLRVRRQLGISRESAQRMSAEERARGQAMIDDGAPLEEVARTLGRDRRTVASNFPDAPRLPPAERARISHLSKKLAEVERAPIHQKVRYR